MMRTIILAGVLTAVCLAASAAGPALHAQNVQPAAPAAGPGGQIPIYQVTVVGRTIDAVNYHVRGGETKIQFTGTPLLPDAKGQAKVQVMRGATRIQAEFSHVNPASRFGPAYLTYVLWAITPDGRATNLGEVQLRGTSAKLDVTTPLQNFGLVITAEPYFAVSRPSDLVVMQNVITPQTVGAVQPIQARYELLQRGQYTRTVQQSEVTPIEQNPKVPLDYYEAENAVRIAGWAGAEQYAPDVYARAQQELEQARGYLARKAGIKPIATVSRAAAQSAEDARLLSLRRQQQEAIAKQRAAEQQRVAEARAAAQSAQQRSAEAAAERVRAEAQRAQAEAQRQQAEAQQQQAQLQRQQAEQAAAQARQAAQQAELQRQQAEQQRLQAERQTAAMRSQLQQQLNQVLQTRNTARGLIVNMSDVLFDFNKYTLKSGAQLKLAKVAGILLAHPDLKVRVEGYTDNIGTPEYNQQLSQQRADTVRNFLVQQGVSSDNVTAQGFGEANPVAPNSTPAGRQQNRRVDMVVSGASIGTPATTTPGGNEAPAPTATP